MLIQKQGEMGSRPCTTCCQADTDMSQPGQGRCTEDWTGEVKGLAARLVSKLLIMGLEVGARSNSTITALRITYNG